jgi:NOL1/NOP2/fmu family ribosome biogenesis protein/precorrin-6B methylase 2
MLVAEALDPQPGEHVLDLAAAPGGKTTHLAAKMRNTGLLVANEIHPRRVWDLAENLERCAVRIAAVTSDTPKRLADQLEGFFDRVLIDAPCSGEGLFRRNPEARAEWSPRLVAGCALRQTAILADAARLVRPGGRLVYSTCTFAPEENEGIVADFLERQADFSIVALESQPGFDTGRLEWAGESAPPALRQAVRLWPHRAPGEGHFIAILEKRAAGRPGSRQDRIKARPPEKLPRSWLKLFQAFVEENLPGVSEELRLAAAGTYLYHRPAGLPDAGKLRVIHPGWWLGAFKKNRFEPAHALALGLQKDDARRTVALAMVHPKKVHAYLRGESFPVEDQAPGDQGWALVTLDGFPLGWGKIVNGVLKNFYPRGLRWMG